MNLSEKIKRTEEEFPITFANVLRKEYGSLFYNEKNKISHDSNHAIIYPQQIKNLSSVLTEIKEFYIEKGLIPRIYQSFRDGYFETNRIEFESCGYDIEIYGSNQYMLLEAENNIKINHNLTIRRITEWDNRVEEDIYAMDEDTFTPIVLKESLKNESCYCFVGYLNEKAVTTASVYYSEYGVARLDSVETASTYRGKGYSREIISFIIEYHKLHKKCPFYLWPANDTAKKIYYEAGFRFLFEQEAGEAVYGGSE